MAARRPATCPSCGRQVMVNKTGRLRVHSFSLQAKPTYHFIVECADCGGSIAAGPSQDDGAVVDQAVGFIVGHDCPARRGGADA